ncbi:MAG: hypothetical protein ABI724_11760 [Betaproteobacteria bacterium]
MLLLALGIGTIGFVLIVDREVGDALLAATLAVLLPSWRAARADISATLARRG